MFRPVLVLLFLFVFSLLSYNNQSQGAAKSGSSSDADGSEIKSDLFGYTATLSKKDAEDLLALLRNPITDSALAVANLLAERVPGLPGVGAKLYAAIITANSRLFKTSLESKIGPSGVVIKI
jgi:hypothetical protein